MSCCGSCILLVAMSLGYKISRTDINCHPNDDLYITSYSLSD